MNIEEIKIVADSSADTLNIDGVSFAVAPLRIITAETEYVDDASLNVEKMADDLLHYNGKSSTACPSVADYLDAFDGAKYIFCVAITSGLSGSYNSACLAKQEYEKKNPDAKVFVIDTLSAGPELRLIIEKLQELVLKGKDFDKICKLINKYQEKTRLLFTLQSLKNFANNGRVNPLVAKAAGLLNIRFIGKASKKGTLEMLEKSRGEKRALKSIIDNMKKMGFKNGKVKIGHCNNEETALTLKDLILNEFSAKSEIEIYPLRGLCSFYAEKGGILIGFEK